ncbi:MAG TPA: hypothetical protein VMU57_16540 [Edaphobacter sp.]|uniref:hypothetical protein n=1 Tax=Edaphobacter sp. TaxID=1934404 RepID=UPI002C14B5BF|nr:hypothetical protein [Edaphobacter sp.]HUZ96511.1 hypothetical protein [Edaphobacter sp.]
MGEQMKVSLSNPLGVFLGSFTIFLTGIAIGECWHPSKTVALAVTVLAAGLAAAHELLSCLVWGSLTAWLIGRHAATLEKKC